MAEILAGVATLAAYPIQTVLVIVILLLGVYWFIKLRPKEREEKAAQEKARNDVMDKFVEAIHAQKVTTAETAANYDKLAEHSIRVIENNTSTLQVTLHNLEMFTHTLAEKIKQDDSISDKYDNNQIEILRILKEIESMLKRLIERQS